MRIYANMARCGGVYCGRGIMAEFNAKLTSLYIIYNISNILSFSVPYGTRRKKKKSVLVMANKYGEF